MDGWQHVPFNAEMFVKAGGATLLWPACAAHSAGGMAKDVQLAWKQSWAENKD